MTSDIQSGDGLLAAFPVLVVVGILLSLLWMFLGPPSGSFLLLLLAAVVGSVVIGAVLYLAMRAIMRTELLRRERERGP